jgi:uncharacterized NAD(P)/FAD-binding protein YdhS
MERNVIRLAIIGGGVSAGALLRALAGNLRKSNRVDRRVVIEVYDPCDAIGRGLAYGHSSGLETLCISDSRHLFPERLLSHWHEWVIKNQREIFDRLHEYASRHPSLKEWLFQNHEKVRPNSISSVYFPRGLIGEFLNEEFEKTILSSKPALFDFEHIKDTVVDVVRLDSAKYEVRCASGRAEFFDMVVLATGSPSKKGSFSSIGPNYISNLYSPSIDINLSKLSRCDKSQNVLIVGGNAAALDALYILRHSPSFQGHITLISRSAALPDRIVPSRSYPDPTRLNKLIYSSSSVDMNQLVDTAIKEIHTFKNSGYNSNQLTFIRDKAAEYIRQMDPILQAEFCETRAMDFVGCLRRAGDAYCDAVDYLKLSNRLSVISGEARNVEVRDRALVVSWIDAFGLSYHKVFDWVIDATGWEDTRMSKNPLIKALSTRSHPLITLSRSGRGIKVDNLMRADENLFVFGPLLAGSVIEDRMIWHLESTFDIETLAPVIASNIVCSL